MIKVVGADLSLNHLALVLLKDGRLGDYHFITNKKGDADKRKTHSTYLPLDSTLRSLGGDKHRFAIWRLDALTRTIRDKLVEWSPDYVGVEDYALGAEHGAHQLGEIGGVIRWMLYSLGIPYRLHDPTTLKMFVAHDGTCSKTEVELSVIDRWKVDFSELNTGRSKDGGRQTSEDLSDAFGLAQMVWTEVQIRDGRLKLSDLHAKEIAVFNRMTKHQPVPLISREWISG